MRLLKRNEDFMSIALDLARLAEGRTSPNPMVGCVIVKDGKILATGFHKQAGLPHAEIEAIRKLRIPNTKLQGATLYVNLEPCCHYGRTPPCTNAIIRSGIRRVVIGMKDPDRKVCGRGIRLIKRAGIGVTTGVLERECRDLNQAYIRHRVARRPFVYLKMAVALNGMVGWKGRGPIRSSLHVTGREAQRLAHHYRDRVDAILVGIKTVLADDPRLTTRLGGNRGRDPLRVVLDSRLRIPLSSRLLHLQSDAKTVIVTTRMTEKAQAIRRLGSEVWISPRNQNGGIDLKPLLQKLAEEGVVSLLVEGGPQIWSSFLRERLADHLLLFVGCRGIKPTQRRSPVFAPLGDLLGRSSELTYRPVGSDLFVEASLQPPEMGSRTP